MYDVYASGDLSCALNYQKLYATDLQEAQAFSGALTTPNCTSTNGYIYVTRTCNFTNGYEIMSSYTSPNCLGAPFSVSNLAPNTCLGSNNPPVRYMGCTANRTSIAKSGFLNTSYYNAPSPEVRLYVLLLVFRDLRHRLTFNADLLYGGQFVQIKPIPQRTHFDLQHHVC